MIKNCDWESALLGLNIAQIYLTPSFSTHDLITFKNSNNIQVFCTLIPVFELEKIIYVEKNNFHFVSQKVTLSRKIKQNPKAVLSQLYKSGTDDVNDLKQLTQNLFKYSRFSVNPFSEEMANIIYKNWIENSVYGNYDDICFHSKSNQNINGFITLKKINNTTLSISLIGVASNSQGQGIGHLLISKAIEYCQANNIDTLEVCTESANIPALNFYIANDFKIKQIENWYYQY